MPKVSVIIPNYNHERYLLQRIRSVLDQTHQNIEVIILDDCSTDNSRSVIEQFRGDQRISHIVFNDTNSGSTFKQWEKGLLLATGEWIWIAESDDYCDPEFLKTLINAANTYTDVGIAFCRSHWVNETGTEGEELAIYKTTFFKHGAEVVKEMAIHCTVQNVSSAIIKKQCALKAISGLGKYKACGDWVFYTRLLQHANLVHVGKQLNSFRFYHANISSKAKERLWMTEGVDVLQNIDYRLVTFRHHEFIDLMRYWKWKASSLTFKDKMTVWSKVLSSATRYFLLP